MADATRLTNADSPQVGDVVVYSKDPDGNGVIDRVNQRVQATLLTDGPRQKIQ